MIREPTVQTMLDDTNVTTTPADLGTPINVAGYGDVTLYAESAATSTNDLTLDIYVLPSGDQPSATTSMHHVVQKVVDVSEHKIMAYAIDVATKWIWVKGSHATGTAKVTLKVMGSAANL